MENRGEVDQIKEVKVEENQGEANKVDKQWEVPIMYDSKLDFINFKP